MQSEDSEPEKESYDSENKKIKLTILLLPSGKSYKVGVPPNWMVETFIVEFKRKAHMNYSSPMIAFLNRTNRELDPHSTFEKEAIIDGDVVILREHIIGGGGDSLTGDPKISPRHSYYCRVHGLISSPEIEWQGIMPCCPQCENNLDVSVSKLVRNKTPF